MNYYEEIIKEKKNDNDYAALERYFIQQGHSSRDFKKWFSKDEIDRAFDTAKRMGGGKVSLRDVYNLLMA